MLEVCRISILFKMLKIKCVKMYPTSIKQLFILKKNKSHADQPCGLMYYCPSNKKLELEFLLKFWMLRTMEVIVIQRKGTRCTFKRKRWQAKVLLLFWTKPIILTEYSAKEGGGLPSASSGKRTDFSQNNKSVPNGLTKGKPWKNIWRNGLSVSIVSTLQVVSECPQHR